MIWRELGQYAAFLLTVLLLLGAYTLAALLVLPR